MQMLDTKNRPNSKTEVSDAQKGPRNDWAPNEQPNKHRRRENGEYTSRRGSVHQGNLCVGLHQR
jgi:hypothetical protein